MVDGDGPVLFKVRRPVEPELGRTVIAPDAMIVAVSGGSAAGPLSSVLATVNVGDCRVSVPPPLFCKDMEVMLPVVKAILVEALMRVLATAAVSRTPVAVLPSAKVPVLRILTLSPAAARVERTVPLRLTVALLAFIVIVWLEEIVTPLLMFVMDALIVTFPPFRFNVANPPAPDLANVRV